MHSFKELQEVVNKYFNNYNFKQHPENLYKPIEYALSIGGKRIRPILSLMACEIFADDYKPALEASIGLEIFHNFTLLHDDIMDNADMRRGKPVVHVKWNKNIALLSGDAMSIIAYQHIAKVQRGLNECLEVFGDTALKICEGQQIDIDFEMSQNVKLCDYLEMIKLKTAVLIACSLKIGAIAGGADIDTANKMYEVGINLGMAFQLQDDLLDVFGSPEVFGKNIGGDIVANKKTYLLVSALEKSKGDTKVNLETWINKIDPVNSEKIIAITQIYKDLGIDVLCKNEISKFFKKAIESLNIVAVKDERKQLLKELILMLENRNY